mgnify:CR=1 FL=1
MFFRSIINNMNLKIIDKAYEREENKIFVKRYAHDKNTREFG